MTILRATLSRPLTEIHSRTCGYDIFKVMHVTCDHGMIDDFTDDPDDLIQDARAVFEKGDYVAIFGWIQRVLRFRPAPPEGVAESINLALA